MWILLEIVGLVGYLLGSLNGAVCVSAWFSHDDVRNHGSGNAGLTNFIRSYGSGKALFVILIDAGKAVLACLLGRLLLESFGKATEGAMMGGFSVMLGHMFPVFLKFKGGKGVLSGLFVALMVDWRIALVILGVFAVVYFSTWYVSLASVLAATTFGVAFVVFYWNNWQMAVVGAMTGALAVYMHRGNIVRLLRGEERKTNLFSRNKQ